MPVLGCPKIYGHKNYISPSNNKFIILFTLYCLLFSRADDLRICTTKTSAAFVPGVRFAMVSLAMAALALVF